jgi:hypothetical protein
MENIFLGELPQNTGTSAAGYDNSGVNPNLNPAEVIQPDQEQENAPKTTNNWIMYLGVGIMAYVLLFKKK